MCTSIRCVYTPLVCLSLPLFVCPSVRTFFCRSVRSYASSPLRHIVRRSISLPLTQTPSLCDVSFDHSDALLMIVCFLYIPVLSVHLPDRLCKHPSVPFVRVSNLRQQSICASQRSCDMRKSACTPVCLSELLSFFMPVFTSLFSLFLREGFFITAVQFFF